MRSLLHEAVLHPSLMQLPANALFEQGQCGKLTMLPLHASANTNTMTAAPNRSFSSSRVFRKADAGQAFAPFRPPPRSEKGPPPKYRLKNSVRQPWT